MLKVGDEFNYDGVNYLVIDLFNVGEKAYVLFSTENKKASYEFYEMSVLPNGDLDLNHIKDNDLKSFLFTIESERIKEENE